MRRGTHWIGGSVDCRASLDMMLKVKIPAYAGIQATVQLIASYHTD